MAVTRRTGRHINPLGVKHQEKCFAVHIIEPNVDCLTMLDDVSAWVCYQNAVSGLL